VKKENRERNDRAQSRMSPADGATRVYREGLSIARSLVRSLGRMINFILSRPARAVSLLSKHTHSFGDLRAHLAARFSHKYGSTMVM